MGLAQHRGPGKTWQHRAKTKLPVETIGGLGQIAPRIFALTDGVVAPAGRAFDVAQQCIDPTCAAHLAGRPTASGFQHRVVVPGVGHAAKAVQTVAEDLGIRG